MSIQITISGTTIEFPSSAQAPNWAPALIEFAQLVESALIAVSGPFDVPPQAIGIINTGIKTNISVLQFSSASVKSVFIRYAFQRQIETSAGSGVYNKQYETGTLQLVSDTSSPISQGWKIQREFIGNTTPVENPSGTISEGLMFYVDNSGQISYDASIMTGAPGTYTGTMTFTAQALVY
jgi:hypothetical protein